MANEVTTAAWSAVLPTVVRRRFIEFARREAIIAPLCAAETIGPGQGKSLVIARSADAAGVGGYTYKPSEGTDLVNAPLTPTAVTLTAAMGGIGFEVSRLASQGIPQANPDYFFEQGAGALAQKHEDDIAALFTALNGGTVVGSTGVDLTFAQFLDGIVTINSNQAVGTVSAVLHPIQVADLMRSLGGFGATANVGGAFAGTQTAAAVDRLANIGLVGNIGGVVVYQSARCPTANAGADRAGAIFVPDAIGAVWMWKAEVSSIENPYLPGIQMSVTAAWGVAETADPFGVAVVTDA